MCSSDLADAASSTAYQRRVDDAAEDYNAAVNAYWASMTGAMMGMMGMGDPSILYNAAKQYAIDVAFAGVAKTAADGASSVAFVSSERPADTTRDQAVNTADNALAVARANAGKSQALRDADFKDSYLKAQIGRAHV